MRNRSFNTLLWIGLTGSFIFGTSFVTDMYQAFRGDHNIWWTNQAMKLSFEKTKDNFELYIGGKLLQKHMRDQTLYSTDSNGKQYPVVSGDISVRLNNWDKVKASILSRTAMSGFAFGITITLLTMGLIQTFQEIKKPRQL